jgi:hypothetical protein
MKLQNTSTHSNQAQDSRHSHNLLGPVVKALEPQLIIGQQYNCQQAADKATLQ